MSQNVTGHVSPTLPPECSQAERDAADAANAEKTKAMEAEGKKVRKKSVLKLDGLVKPVTTYSK